MATQTTPRVAIDLPDSRTHRRLLATSLNLLINEVEAPIPTSDPGIPGAIFSNGVPSAGNPKALMVSGG